MTVAPELDHNEVASFLSELAKTAGWEELAKSPFIHLTRAEITEIEETFEENFSQTLAAEFPTVGFYGGKRKELRPAGQDGLFHFDVLDGTGSLSKEGKAAAADAGESHRPGWGVTAALLNTNHKPVASAILDGTNEDVWQATDKVSLNGKEFTRNSSSTPATLSDQTTISITVEDIMFGQTHEGQALLSDLESTGAPIISGRNVSGFCDLMAGRISAVVEGDLKANDLAPIVHILEKLGFSVTDTEGQPIDLSDPEALLTIVAAPPELHKKIIQITKQYPGENTEIDHAPAEEAGYETRFKPDGTPVDSEEKTTQRPLPSPVEDPTAFTEPGTRTNGPQTGGPQASL